VRGRSRRLGGTSGALSFQVEDDGVGFDPRTTPGGIGLQSMTDRLEALGGSLVVGSEPGSGTTVKGSFPEAP
jgi:signal transduction histidine kinase